MSQPRDNAPRLGLFGPVLAAATLVAAVLTCLLPPVAPGQDTPPHIVGAFIMSAPELFSPWFTHPGSPTAHAFETWAAWLIPWVGPFAATRVVTSLLTMALALGAGFAARSVGGSLSAGIALGAAYAVGWNWAMGFYNFLAALALGVWAIPLVFGRGGDRLPNRVGAALLLVAAAWAHIVGAAMLLLHMLLLRLALLHQRPPQPSAARLLVRDTATALPALGYTLSVAYTPIVGMRAMGRTDSIGTDHAAFSLPDVFGTTFGGFIGWGMWPGLAAALAVAAGLAHRPSRRIALVSGFWLLLLAAVPLHMSGWHFVGARFGFFSLALGVAALPALGRSRPLSLAAATVGLALCWAGLPGALTEGERAATAVDALRSDTPVGRTFEAVFGAEPLAPSGPHVRSGIGLTHYATLAGGAVPGAFATTPIMNALAFRDGPAAVFPDSTRWTLDVSRGCLADPACYGSDDLRADQIAASASQWDSVAVIDAPPGVAARLAARGFVQRAPMLWVPRPAQLHVPLPPGLRGQVTWRAGYPDTAGLIHTGSAHVSEDGAVVRLTDLPAGPILLEVDVAPADGRARALVRATPSLSPGQTEVVRVAAP